MPRLYIDSDITRARTIATEVYTSPEIYAEAREKIFANSWQFAGDTDRVPEPGCVWPFTLLDQYLSEPLLLSRDQAGELHCMSNVCTHRGNLVAYEPCKSSQLRRRYHGRVFGLDGKFQFMPEFTEVKDFPSESDHLKKLPLFNWGKLLFTSLNPVLPPEDFLGSMMQRIGWLPLDQLQFYPEYSKDYLVQANWALYCENYLEGFHIPFVHNSLSAVLDWRNYSTELFQYSSLQLGIAKNGAASFELPPSSPDYGKQVAAYYFWVFPNMMFNFYPWGLSLNIVEPQSVSTCKVRFKVYVMDETKLNLGAGAGLDQVEIEDEAVVENVQRGIRSRFYTHGRYAPNHEQGTHHFHQLLAKFLG